MQSANLNLLRAAAVLCVYFAHLIPAVGWGAPSGFGRFGVVMFFVHTSLVLTASLERLDAAGISSKWRLYCAFLTRRVFRIYPLAIVFVLLAVSFRSPTNPGRLYEWAGLPVLISNLTLTQNLFYHDSIIGQLWTLPLEVQMYCLLPLAYFILRRNWRYGAALLWLVAVLLALTVPKLVGRLNVLSFAPCFMAGMVAFDLRRRATWMLPAWAWPLILSAAIILFNPLDDNTSLFDKLPRAWILSIAIGIGAAHVRESPWPRLNAMTHIVAEYSYGVYLSHMMVFWLAIDVLATWPMVARALVLMVMSCAVPFAFYWCVERPFIRLGGSIAARLAVRPAAPDGLAAHGQA